MDGQQKTAYEGLSGVLENLKSGKYGVDDDIDVCDLESDISDCMIHIG